MSFSHGKQVALALVPKISGSVSLVASSIIVFTVARDRKKRRETYHRLIGAASCINVVTSFWAFMSTWPIPRASGVLWAAGNTQICTTQGFFFQFFLASAMYSANLSVYYALTIVYRWSADRIWKIEPFLHAVPLLFGLGTAIAGIPLTLFNNANIWCGIASFPSGCEGNECIRGENADNIYRWAFFYGPLWLAFAVLTVLVLIVLAYVWRVEKASEAYNFRPQVTSSRLSSRRRMKRTKQVARQCFLYAGGFYFTFTPITVLRIIMTVDGRVPFAGALVAVITAPLLGLPNALVYLAPMYQRQRRRHPDEGIRNWFKGALAPTTHATHTGTYDESIAPSPPDQKDVEEVQEEDKQQGEGCDRSNGLAEDEEKGPSDHITWMTDQQE